MKVTSADDTSIHYKITGRGQITLVLLHGWMMTGRVFDTLIARLDPDTYRFVVPDFRGVGASEVSHSDYALSRYVEDVHALLTALDTPVHLIGHSMGGQIAQCFAATHPEMIQSLTLLCPVPATGAFMPDELIELFSTSGQDAQKQDQILSMACLNLSDEDKQSLLRDAASVPKDVIKQSFFTWFNGIQNPGLDRINVPTTLLGTDDPFLPPKFLQNTVIVPIKNANFIYISGAGHYIQQEQGEACANAITTFLESL